MPHRLTAPITLTAVQALQPLDVLNDTKIKGFMARRQQDAVSYALKLRVYGRQRWITIGRHGQPWTPDMARREALQILADPTRADKRIQPEVMTYGAASLQFFASHGGKLKPRSLIKYQNLNRLYLLPAFDTIPITAMTRATISTAHAGWNENPRAANQSSLSSPGS